MGVRILSNPHLEAPITDPKHLVNKQYVDTIFERSIKEPVRAASVDNFDAIYNDMTLTANTNGALVIDEVELNIGDRVLLKDQLDAKQNGIYVVEVVGDENNPAVLIRSDDCNASNKIPKNLFIRVSEGTVQGDILFQLINDEDIVLDVSDIIFMPYKAGNGSGYGGALLVNQIYEITEDDWQEVNDEYVYTIEHNLSSDGLVVNFFNVANEHVLVYYQIINDNEVLVVSSKKEFIRAIINYTSSASAISSYEIYPVNWSEIDNGYAYIINHNLGTKNLMINCYNLDDENVFIVYYKTLDENNLIVMMRERQYLRVVVNYLQASATRSISTGSSPTYIGIASDWEPDDNNYKCIIQHNLNSEDIIACFYEDKEAIDVHYRIMDENNIILFSNVDNISIKVVIKI